jgi:hypothetical protein
MEGGNNMALPQLQRQFAERLLGSFCEKRVPAEEKDRMRIYYKIRGNSITLMDSRPGLLPQGDWLNMSIAQFRYDESNGTWTLYCADRNDKWHLYMDCDPSKDLSELLKEVDDDPTGIFFG